jgi:hypothetical protein
MTNKIKELVEQAGFSFKYKTAPDELNPGHKLQDLEKFAELIVKECANEILKWKSEPFPFDPEFAAKFIKEHFGMK